VVLLGEAGGTRIGPFAFPPLRSVAKDGMLRLP
jgi:hypothetical protein